jgi:ABC-2 type transport system ATP-binding protein
VTAILEFDNVVRSYGKSPPVLNGVSFSLGNEEVVGLLGRNGAGKTTLVNIAMGMLFPQTGTARVFGMSPTVDPVAIKMRIGYVAEDQVLPSSARIKEILVLYRHLFPTWDRKLEEELMERFGLAGNTQKIKQLSKGQARQVALVCAISHRPELLILDEPAGGLDPAARREFLEISVQLLNREGSSVLFSSHHMGDVERLGARVVLLHQGKVLVDRGLDQLREEHCVAIVPRTAIKNQVAAMALPGCLRARAMDDTWHIVLAGAPEKMRQQLGQSLAIEDVHCVSMPLEELFIELVGGERVQQPS